VCFSNPSSRISHSTSGSPPIFCRMRARARRDVANDIEVRVYVRVYIRVKVGTTKHIAGAHVQRKRARDRDSAAVKKGEAHLRVNDKR
jgi:hypothetical protein